MDVPLGFAFSAGMVAAFNPCGFALLPAYLSVFLARGDDPASPGAVRLSRAVAVAGWVALGFAAVFGLGGLLITRTAVTVQEYTPWLTVGIGAALVPAGIAMARGWTPKLPLPAAHRPRKAAGPAAMFWFGVSYATVSLSCTIPAFLVAVAGTFSTAGVGEGMAVFAAYTAGMAAVLAVLAGAYVAYHGWYEIRLDADPPAGPIVAVGDASGAATRWVAGVGAGPVAVARALCGLAVAATRLRRRG
jgi:cytochrome c biogenesis protein CcdA